MKPLVILFIVKILARINIFKNITLTGKRNTIFTGKEVSSIPIIFQWTFWIMFNFPSKNVKNIFEKNNIIFAGKYRNCYNHHYYIERAFSAKDNPVGNYMLKVNNRNTSTRCETCSKLTVKTPERRHWQSSVSFVNFEQVNTYWGESIT